jgi:hypothetical protein
LTNIASSTHEHTSAVLPTVPDLIQIVNSDTNSVPLKEQVCWTIGNIAGDSDEFREVLIANGSLPVVVSFAIESMQSLNACMCSGNSSGSVGDAITVMYLNGLRTALWALSNLSRGIISASYFVVNGE